MAATTALRIPARELISREELAFPPTFNFFDAMVRKSQINYLQNADLVSSSFSTAELYVAAMSSLSICHESR